MRLIEILVYKGGRNPLPRVPENEKRAENWNERKHEHNPQKHSERAMQP